VVFFTTHYLCDLKRTEFEDNLTRSLVAGYNTPPVVLCIGRDNEHAPLPLITPLNGESALSFSGYHFTADASLQASARQSDFSAEYGEDRTPGYLIANLSIGYGWRIRETVLHLKTGVENVFDKRYSTYSDWNNISRKGRNIFINVGIEIL
jgi:iron complex outermembrane receptor protein